MKFTILQRPASFFRRVPRVAGAYIAYFTAVCASMAAAAAFVSETVPLVVGGL